MPANTLQLDVTILGREYRVACAEGEQPALLEAVALLDTRMREIRDKGRTPGVDRIAVMAALNIAHELLVARTAPTAPASTSSTAANGFDMDEAKRRMRSMQATLDSALAPQEKLFE